LRADRIPALRRDLEVRPRRDGTVEVRDPRLLQIFTVDEEDWIVAQAFDGSSDAAQVAVKLAGKRTMSALEVGSLAADFDRLCLLDSARAKKAKPAKDTLAPPSLMDSGRLVGSPIPEPGARWTCHGCGACCHNLAVELTKPEDARIDRSLYDDILGDQDYAEEQFISPGEPARRILRQQPERGQACIFLLPDGLCAIHARQGMEAKPNACQTFPLMVVKAPYRPARLGVRVNCQSMGRSSESGPPLEVHLEHASRIFSGLPLHRIPSRFEMFGAELSFRTFEAITDDIQAELALLGVTAAALRSIDKKHLGGRITRRKKSWALEIAAYVKAEAAGTIPTGEGAYRWALQRVVRANDALRSLAEDRAAPAVKPEVDRFLRAQLAHVLWLGGPLHAPDAGIGLVGLMIALEASVHAVGPQGTVEEATHAFDVFTSPVLETLEHMWPVLDAIDPRYAKRVREEMS